MSFKKQPNRKVKSVAEEVFEKIDIDSARWEAASDAERDLMTRHGVNQALAKQREKERTKELQKSVQPSVLEEFLEKYKVIVPIIFWGLGILLIWWLSSGGSGSNLDPNALVDPATERIEDICPSGPY